MFTLLEFECLGACDRAPVVMVNNEHWHEKATPESCARLVDDLKAKGAGRADRLPLRRSNDRLVVSACKRDSEANRMEPVLTKYVREPNSYTLDFFLKHEGYEGLKKALAMKPDAVIDAGQGLGAARPRRRRVSRPA